MALPLVGGEPPVLLSRAPDRTRSGPQLLEVSLLPGRGMTVHQVRARFPSLGDIDLLCSPTLEQAALLLNGGPGDYKGVGSFAFGGAFLVPFANRIRGRVTEDGKGVLTNILRREVRLPADWPANGKGREKCAIHGLMLDSRMQIIEVSDRTVRARLDAGDFGGHWISHATVEVEAALNPEIVAFTVLVGNAGAEDMSVGIGWHPWFRMPSGRREQVRLHLPGRRRTLVDNYEDVFPTGRIVPVSATPYDFTAPGGAALSTRYFDDTFTDLKKTPEGKTVIQIFDDEARYAVRLTAHSPHVNSVQLYAPPDQPVVVVEPQFNLPDPFSAVWPNGTDTGMVTLRSGEETKWSVSWEIFET